MGKLAWLTKPRMLLLGVAVVAIIGLPWYFTTEIYQRKPDTTVTGKYLAVAFPCTTKPTLHGSICVGVYAVLVDSTYYYLTVEGSFLLRPCAPPFHYPSWDGYTPREGDYVTVTGHATAKVYVYGDSFYEIEVISLKPAKPTLITLNNIYRSSAISIYSPF